MTPNTRILIVEDEGIIARDIMRQLTELGYIPIDVATTGADAIALAETGRPDAILMDIHLQGDMDGIEAARVIRTRLAIPVIFLTAYATGEMVERAKTADASGYLIKPFDEQLLRTTIEIALNKARVESELRRSERRYRAVVESALDPVITTDANGRIVGWSPSASKRFGPDESEVLGRSLKDFVPERWHESFDEVYGALVEGQGARGPGRVWDFDALDRDGREFPVEVSMSAWSSDEGRFVTALFRDLTRREQAQSLLNLQGAALEAAGNSIVISDRHGRVEWVNSAFTSLTGYTLAEVLGRAPRELLSPEIGADPIGDEMGRAVKAKRVWQGEITERHKDGHTFPAELTVTPVLDAEGNIAHFIGVERDLTTQKQLQDQFMQAQRMDVVGRLAGGVAHDFNNLLTVINGTSELALDTLDADDPLAADLKEIRAAGERAAQLTRQLLAFSRQEVVAPVVVCLGDEVTLASRMISRLVSDNITVSVTTTDSPELDHVLIDRGQLEHLLMNLIVNARDAMPDGGALTIDTRPVDIEIAPGAPSALRVGPYVCLTVSDTGTGIPPELVGRIFEPFFTTKRQGKGTGLGLSTVYGTVHQCGGDIVVTSEPGKGSTFAIYLPRVSGPARNDDGGDVTGEGGETILLVEDEPEVRVVAMRMLRAARYHVIPAGGGEEALALLADGSLHIDLLLTDVLMPGMSGPELADRVRVMRPDAQIMFASGFAETGRISRDIVLDTKHFLPKPFSVGDLTSRVRRLLDEPRRDRQA